MCSPSSRLGYPLGKVRLYTSIPPAVVFGFFIFQASTVLNWFTPFRQFYLLLGVTIGLLIGTVEARFILRELSSNSEAIVLKPLLVGAVLVCLPLLLVLVVFGVEEYLPFGAYFVLSAIPVYLATSGWFYAKFEKVNQVRIFVSLFGFKYWREPVEDLSARFYHFIRDVVTNQPSSIWWHVGYVKKFIELEEKQDIEPLTRKELLELLKAMNRYRKIGLSMLGIFLTVVFGFFLFFFLGAAGIISIPERQLLEVVGPGSGVIFFGFLISVFVMMRQFRKMIAEKLANLDSNKLYSLL